METPELSVQPSMKKCVILILLYKGLQFREKLKDNRNVEQESSGQYDQERTNDKAVDEKEFLIWEEIKEK